MANSFYHLTEKCKQDLVFFLGILWSDIIQWKRTLPGYDSVIFIGFRQLAVVTKEKFNSVLVIE